MVQVFSIPLPAGIQDIPVAGRGTVHVSLSV